MIDFDGMWIYTDSIKAREPAREVEMLSEERQGKIVSLINENKSMTVQMLMKILNASESTIRRDLSELNDKGLIEKVYGGAMAKDVTFSGKDEAVNIRMEQNREEKILIAKYAASLVCDDDFVYLDAGTTTEFMIPFITAKKAVFVTNGFSHARKLSEAGFVTYILGGEVKFPTEAVVGEEAVLMLFKYHFTKGFWGTNGISLSSGFSTPDVKEALIKQMSMSRTREKYILGDSSKFSKISCVTFGDFSDATILTNGLENNLSTYRSYKNIVEVKEQ